MVHGLRFIRPTRLQAKEQIHMRRILLLMPTKTYRASAFLQAAHALPLDIVVGTERQQALEPLTEGKTVTLDFRNVRKAVASIVAFSTAFPIDAIVPVDDETVLLASHACQALGLLHNSIESSGAVTNKYVMRKLLRAAGLPSPDFEIMQTTANPEARAPHITYPCILKPLFLSGSKGVIRANSANEFLRAFERIAAILAQPEVRSRDEELSKQILIESYIPGAEVAFEGILTDGVLKTLALFDKPDPMEGPFFEETLYITPSRQPAAVQQAIQACVADTCVALGLRTGPVHAELRLNQGEIFLIEIAGRSIGGYCSRMLRFNDNMSLETLLLRHAMGEDISAVEREKRAAGVMMIPITTGGTLQHVSGVREARAIPGIEDVVIAIPLSQRVVPLPEGTRYLGFIFSRNETPKQVEVALREALSCLRFTVNPSSG